MVVFIGGFWYAIDRLGIVEYFRYQSEESYLIEENFVDPNSIALTFPEKKKNLIYIYLESMETTYQSKEEGGIFDFNCIPELTNLAKENVSFRRRMGLEDIYLVTAPDGRLHLCFASPVAFRF